MNYTDYNAKAWDAIAEGRTEDGRAQFTKIISHEDYLRAKEGILQVSLTSSKYVPESWVLFLRRTVLSSQSWICLPDNWSMKIWQQKEKAIPSQLCCATWKSLFLLRIIPLISFSIRCQIAISRIFNPFGRNVPVLLKPAGFK